MPMEMGSLCASVCCGVSRKALRFSCHRAPVCAVEYRVRRYICVVEGSHSSDHTVSWRMLTSAMWLVTRLRTEYSPGGLPPVGDLPE